MTFRLIPSNKKSDCGPNLRLLTYTYVANAPNRPNVDPEAPIENGEVFVINVIKFAAAPDPRYMIKNFHGPKYDSTYQIIVLKSNLSKNKS